MSREPTEMELKLAKAGFERMALIWNNSAEHRQIEHDFALQNDFTQKCWIEVAGAIMRELHNIDHAVLDIGCAKLRRASGEMAQAWQAMIDYMSPAQ